MAEETDVMDAEVETDSQRTAQEIQIARNNFDRYSRARDNGHKDYVDLAKKCEDFYVGDQWSSKDRERLDEEKRPALTINMVQPIINAVVGEYVNNRQSVQFIPRNEGTEDVAKALTKLYMQICYDNSFERQERLLFEDGVILERGFFDVRMSFDDNFRGEVDIQTLDPLSVVLDPDAKEYDPSTWKEVFITRWMSIDDIEDLYGEEKAQRVRDLSYNSSSTYGYDSVEWSSSATFGEGQGQGSQTTYTPGTVDETKQIRRVRVVERQFKKMRHTRHFLDIVTGDTREVPENWDDERVAELAAEHGWEIYSRRVPEIRWTVSADQVLLHDDWSPYEHFTVVPFFPYFRRGKPFGLIRNLIDPQEQFNKISSQALHIVNSTANSGWMVEEGSLVNMTADELKKHGSRTGLVMEVANGRTPPSKIQPNQIPSGIRDLSNMAMSSIRQISGVSEYMLGEGSGEVSGVVLQGKISRGLAQLQVVFDNLNYTRHLLAERVLSLVQQYYTEERTLRITSGVDSMMDMEVLQLNMQTIDGVLNNLTLGEYDVVVDTVPTRDNFAETQFAEVVELRNAGVMIPDDAVIEYSHLDKKYDLAERVRQMMGQGQPSPEQQQIMQTQQQLEMQKLMLEVEELRAEIEKTQSEAYRNMAKAQSESMQPAYDIKEQKMKSETELTNKTNELLAKLKVAQMQAEAGQMRESQAQTGRYNQTQSVKAGENGL